MSLKAAEGYDKVKVGFRYISRSTWHHSTIFEVYEIGRIVEFNNKVTIQCNVQAIQVILQDKAGKILEVKPYGAHARQSMHTDIVWKARQKNNEEYGELVCELLL
jgi:hypothetical protein